MQSVENKSADISGCGGGGPILGLYGPPFHGLNAQTRVCALSLSESIYLQHSSLKAFSNLGENSYFTLRHSDLPL